MPARPGLLLSAARFLEHEKAKEMIVAQADKHFDRVVVESFLRCEEKFLTVRARYPDNMHVPEGRPFELPARDRN